MLQIRCAVACDRDDCLVGLDTELKNSAHHIQHDAAEQHHLDNRVCRPAQKKDDMLTRHNNAVTTAGSCHRPQLATTTNSITLKYKKQQ